MSTVQHKGNNEFYYGYTSDIERRLAEYRRRNDGWKLIYYEAYRSEDDARDRERKLKHYGQSRTHLKSRFKRSIL